MLRLNRRFLSLFLLILMLIQFMPFHADATEAEKTEKYYGEAYNDLKTEEQRTGYRLLEQCVAGLSPQVNFRNVVDITYSDLLDIIRAVCVDNPQYFWFLESGMYSLKDYSGTAPAYTFEPYYILDGRTITAGSQELLDAMKAFHTKVEQIIKGIPANYQTEYEIALYLHDYLINNVTYTLEGDHPSAYAALIHGEAACYGYSKAYQCLLNAAGIRARTITGESDNGDGKPSGHAWNQVWLDGKCYYTDVTWDDLDIASIHAYFAVPLELISKDHFADKEFVLPECNHDDVNYYALNQGSGVVQVNYKSTAAVLAASFRKQTSEQGGVQFVCEVRSAANDFFAWFDQISGQLAQQMGLSRETTVRYYHFGIKNVYYLVLEDAKYNQESTVKTIQLQKSSITLSEPGASYHIKAKVTASTPWTPDLVYESSDPSVAIVDEGGIVTAVSEGKAVITAKSADGRVKASCNVKVNSPVEHVHNMRYFEAAKSTCKQDGHNEYYLCTECGGRFGDEAGQVEFLNAADYVIPAQHLVHLYIDLGEYHVQRCKCGDEIDESRGKHTDSDSDGNCDICKLKIKKTQQNKPNKEETPSKPGHMYIFVIAGVVILAVVAFFVIRRIRRGY